MSSASPFHPVSSLPNGAIGIGWRQPHYAQILERQPLLDFLEVHSENFFADGGAALATLLQAREHYPISLHGVGLGLGSMRPQDNRIHLQKLARLVKQIDPCLVSEHLCWGSHGSHHFNDLLPMPMTRAALDLFVERVDHLQNTLQRIVLIENVSAYLQFAQADYTETGFLAELSQRSGCQILLDLNNLYVNARNFDLDAQAMLHELPVAVIGEIHLAGHSVTETCLIDTHSTTVCDDVWQLYQAAIQQFGARPTLIEWDNDIPALDILLGEALHAKQLAQSTLQANQTIDASSSHHVTL
ncbi:DUF692 domain-containing protein [Ampullimonas aquatilis]|uniref:MNIO family bufferin maturase n=1 Tax=Ampullimonas aquatilis TaxID=1341549 RepID=UPI003C75EE9C